MDQMEVNNALHLCGTVSESPAYSHSSRGLDFYSFPLTVERLSGNSDTLNILARRDQLDAVPLTAGTRLAVEGEVRSFNLESIINGNLDPLLDALTAMDQARKLAAGEARE